MFRKNEISTIKSWSNGRLNFILLTAETENIQGKKQLLAKFANYKTSDDEELKKEITGIYEDIQKLSNKSVKKLLKAGIKTRKKSITVYHYVTREELGKALGLQID